MMWGTSWLFWGKCIFNTHLIGLWSCSSVGSRSYLTIVQEVFNLNPGYTPKNLTAGYPKWWFGKVTPFEYGLFGIYVKFLRDTWIPYCVFEGSQFLQQLNHQFISLLWVKYPFKWHAHWGLLLCWWILIPKKSDWWHHFGTKNGGCWATKQKVERSSCWSEMGPAIIHPHFESELHRFHIASPQTRWFTKSTCWYQSSYLFTIIAWFWTKKSLWVPAMPLALAQGMSDKNAMFAHLWSIARCEKTPSPRWPMATRSFFRFTQGRSVRRPLTTTAFQDHSVSLGSGPVTGWKLCFKQTNGPSYLPN